MALTPAEQKKMEKLSKLIAEKEKEREALKLKGAEDFSILAMKFNLWMLDRKTTIEELKAIAKKHKMI